MSDILALDQGTTSSRAIVFNADGRPTSKSQKELTQMRTCCDPGSQVLHNGLDEWAPDEGSISRLAIKTGTKERTESKNGQYKIRREETQKEKNQLR